MKTPCTGHPSHLLPKTFLLGALLLALVAWPRSAQAEVIRFDPEADPVPTLLSTEELALLDRLMSGGYVYMISDPSPDGRFVLAAKIQGEEMIMGFIDLTGGGFTPLSDAEVPGSQASNAQWLDNDTLARLHYQQAEDAQGNVVARYYRVTMEAGDGSVAAEELDFSWLKGFVMDVSPGWRDVLVLEFPATPPTARRVDIGPRFEPPVPNVPEDVPGRIGDRPYGSMVLQPMAFQVSLVRLDGTERRPLLSLPFDSGLGALTWDADGSRLAIGTRTMPGWQASRQDRSDPSYVPNLGSINVREAMGLVPPSENPLVTGTRFHFFSTATGDELASLENADHEQGLLADVRFSPRGTKALVLVGLRSQPAERPHPSYAYPRGWGYLLVDLASAPPSVRELDLSAVPAADSLSAEAGFLTEEQLYLAVPDELDVSLYTYDLARRQSTPIWRQPGALLQVLALPDGLVFPYSNVDRPWELWRWSAATGAARPLTAFFVQAAEASRLRFDVVRWTTSDGTGLQGLIVHHQDMPFPPANPWPLVVWQQGGPGGQMVNDFGASVESPYSLLPHFGIPVLVANAAGRSSRSPAFYQAMADGRNFGQLDIQQVKEGVEQLAARGMVDGRRIGLTGCSYGGYFTLQSLRTFPTAYAAVNPQCSLVDLTNEFTFGYTPLISYLMGRSPFADPDEYLRDSPLYGLAGIRTPTLIFHGTEDFLPVPLIDNVHDQLAANGAPVRFLRVEGEGHGFRMDKSQKLAVQEQIRFFRQYLDIGPFAPPPRAEIFLPLAHR